jgi:hypothetical protein
MPDVLEQAFNAELAPSVSIAFNRSLRAVRMSVSFLLTLDEVVPGSI